MSVGNTIKRWFAPLKRSCQTHFHFLQEHEHAPWIFGLSLLIPILAMMVLVVIGPLKIRLPMDNRQIANQPELMPWDAKLDSAMVLRKFSDVMFNLKMEELSLNTRLAMSKSDSIGLLLDLADSTFSLLIRGVTIRECRIHSFKISHAFEHLKTDPQFFAWLSQPFVLQKNWATVPQVPIKIRKAPKDTIEAQKNKFEPVALDKPDVHYTLKFDRNLTLRIHQLEPTSFRGLPRKWYYNLKSYLRMMAELMTAFYHLQTPQADLWIDIKISKNDALAIYRALPIHAELAVKFYFH